MGLTSTVQYQFWDWCIRQANQPDTADQIKCIHDFGKGPLIGTTLGFDVWQCKYCKKLDVSSESED